METTKLEFDANGFSQTFAWPENGPLVVQRGTNQYDETRYVIQHILNENRASIIVQNFRCNSLNNLLCARSFQSLEFEFETEAAAQAQIDLILSHRDYVAANPSESFVFSSFRK